MTPGCELHLLRTGPAQQLLILADDGETEIQADPNTTYTVDVPAVVSVAGGTFTPGVVGDALVLVTFTDAQGQAQSSFVHVHVHEALTSIWIANPLITVRAGSDGFVPSVYGAFDNVPTVVDITGHAYVQVTALPGAPFTILGADPLGRLHVDVNAPPGTVASIAAQAGGLSATASVAIAPALRTERRIVERVRYTGEHTTRRNVLFLAEGYSDKQLFDTHVKQIVERMFSSAMYSPFPQLAQHFNVWSAYELWGAAAAGVTVGPPVTDQGGVYPQHPLGDPDHPYLIDELTIVVGLPTAHSPTSFSDAKAEWTSIQGFVPEALTPETFSAWQRQSTLEPTAPKDSLFGAMYGMRRCGPLAPRPNTQYSRIDATHVPTAHWDLVPATDLRTLTIDVRRLPEHPDFPGHYNPRLPDGVRDLFEPYLESLKLSGVSSDDPDFDVGRVWKSGAADEGLIVLLVYDDILGGTASGYRIGRVRHRTVIAIAVGAGVSVHLTSNGSRVRDHDPTCEAIVDQLTTTVVHELAHAFALDDEYENTDFTAGHNDGQNAPVDDVESAANLMHFSNIIDPATGRVRADQIKWNWDRIVIASEVIEVQPVDPNDLNNPAATFSITLASGQGVKWTAAHDQNIELFLRARDINQTPVPLVGPYTIVSIQGDKLTLKGPAALVLTYTGGILFQPSLSGGSRRTLLYPAVHDFLASHRAFGVNPDIAKANFGGETPPDIPGLSKPKNRQDVIGVYDGGGTFNTNVFRPSGNCRMRNEDYKTVTEFYWARGFIPWFHSVPRVTPFCFVCRYILVNELGPEAFDRLDREYPEDC